MGSLIVNSDSSLQPIILGNRNLLNNISFSGESYQYIVDLYSPTAAYSLRKLSSSATNAIRVRRTSDNSEQDIGFSGGDLDTASLGSFCSGTNGFIVTWYDQSGNGYNLTQSTAAAQPRIVNAGTIDTKGGLPALYNDTGDKLIRNAAILNTISTSYFSVSAAAAGSTLNTIHSQSNTTTNTIRTFCDSRTTPYRNLVVTNTSGTQYAADLSVSRNDTNQRLLSSFIDASKNMSAFDNGATGGTDTYTGNPTNEYFQIGVQSSTLSYFVGYIQEFIAFNTDESANRTAIETNINSYYSIY